IVNSNPQAQALLSPPLWPVPTHSNVCGQTLVAHPEILNQLAHLTPGGRDWCVAWALLCKAENDVWNALLWDLALGVNAVQADNPWQFLVDLYELGVFPMGWTHNDYEIFVPKAST